MARKRQAKLAFSPVSPDSPAAASLSPQVRNRAAAVALDGSPSKRQRPSKKRKIVDMKDDEDRFPSPDARELRRSFREGMHVSTQTSMFGLGAYTRSRAEDSSSENESDVVEPVKEREKSGKSKKKSIGRGPARTKAMKVASESDGAEPPTTSKSKLRKLAKTKAFGDDDSEEEDELQAVKAPPKKQTRASKGKARSTVKATAAPKRQTRLQTNLTVARQPSSDESSEEDPEEQVQSRATQRRNKPQVEPRASPESSDSDEEVRPVRRRIIQRRKPRREDGSEEDDNVSDGNKDERDEILDELEDLRSSPFGSSQRSRAKPRDKKQDIFAQLRKKRAGSNPVSEPASTPGRKKTVIHDSDDNESDSSLEIIDEEDEEEEARADSDDDGEDGSDDGSDQFSDGGPMRARGRGRRTIAQNLYHEDDEDLDFIVDDPEEPLGEPSEHASIPIEFTNWRYKKPAELFKFAVEWMVKKKIAPAFKSTDEIYQLTFQKLNDELEGIAISRSSSAWTPAFTRAVKARPLINMNQMGAMQELLAYCEACNKTSHPATWYINFTGKPYDKKTLEPLVEDKSASDDDSDSSSDSDVSSASEESDSEASKFGYGKRDKHEYNSDGNLLPPETRQFTVGRTCAANARVAHTLLHWRYSLYTWVIEYLDRKGHTSGPSLVKLNKKSDHKREKAANKIVETMEREGEIKKLHRLYKDQIKVALAEKETAEERRYGRERGQEPHVDTNSGGGESATQNSGGAPSGRKADRNAELPTVHYINEHSSRNADLPTVQYINERCVLDDYDSSDALFCTPPRPGGGPNTLSAANPSPEVRPCKSKKKDFNTFYRTTSQYKKRRGGGTRQRVRQARSGQNHGPLAPGPLISDGDKENDGPTASMSAIVREQPRAVWFSKLVKEASAGF